jgi:hypothetical protein
MGGVDLSDQMVSYYDIKWRSLKNWRPIFYFCLDRAVENTRILYNLYHKHLNPHAQQLDALTFRWMLAKTFLHPRARPGNMKFPSQTTTSLFSYDSQPSFSWSSYSTGTQTETMMPNVAQFLSDHILKTIQGRQCCAHCQNQGKHIEPHTICSGCNVGLCLECYTPWHLKELE